MDDQSLTRFLVQLHIKNKKKYQHTFNSFHLIIAYKLFLLHYLHCVILFGTNITNLCVTLISHRLEVSFSHCHLICLRFTLIQLLSSYICLLSQHFLDQKHLAIRSFPHYLAYPEVFFPYSLDLSFKILI